MPNYRVGWKAPASNMPPGSPQEDHYEVKFGPHTLNAPKGSLFADFMDITAPGSYMSFCQLIDVNGAPIGPQGVGPVIVIDEAGEVIVHIPVDVTAEMIVEAI